MTMQKTADDFHLARWPYPAPWGHLLVASGEPQARIEMLRRQAAVLTEQLRMHEEARMSQTIENLGGPGSGRARYVRGVMQTPYAVSPLLPFMGGQGRGPMLIPPGAGVDHDIPLDISAEGPDPEMTALETGITHTASVRGLRHMRSMLEASKTAAGTDIPTEPVPAEEFNPYYGQLLPPPQPVVPQSNAERAGASTAKAIKSLGTGLGESAMATGYGLRAATGAVGKGVSGFARGMREFMSKEQPSGQRWGTGMPPAALTNEYGQPIY